MVESFPFARRFSFDVWANGLLLDTLEELADPPAEAVRLMAHVFAALETWLIRLRGEDPEQLTPWPAADLAGCRRKYEQLRDEYEAYLGGLEEEDLDACIEYATSRGIPFSTEIRDVLSHVFFHGAHHRAQIAAILREAGQQPPALDFIFFTRQLDEDGAA